MRSHTDGKKTGDGLFSYTLRDRRLPPIGARIVKSSLGAAICVLIYLVREQTLLGGGILLYSILAVLWCIQPYVDTTLVMARQRTFGTFLGAVYGLAFLLLFRFAGIRGRGPVYLSASLTLIPILYTTVVLEKRNASYFSCVVFLTIVINHSFDENPYLFVFNRVLDTMIGIGVAVPLNSFHRPIRHRENVLYISGIDSVLVSSREVMIPYNKVELNRLIAQGVRFTISTIRTPASMLDLFSGVHLQSPEIAMDGAVLYDIRENRYLDAFPLERETADKIEKIVEAEGAHCFVNVLYDNTLLIYYGEFRNDAERDLFEKLRCSPYRNYTGKQYRGNEERERVLYIMVLAETEAARQIGQRITRELGDRVRTVLSLSAEYDGYSYLKIYDRNACKVNMIEILKKRTGVERVVTFGSIPGAYDVYVDDDGGNSAVKVLKKLFEGKPLEAISQR